MTENFRTYKIPVHWIVAGTLKIKARSIEEAIAEAAQSSVPAVIDECYVDDSFQVDVDGAMEMNDGIL